MTMIYAMALGADCIEDCDAAALGADRAGCSGGWRARRPRRWARFCARSRSGTCVSSTACSAEALARAWAAGAGPGRRAAGRRRRQLRRRGPRLRQAGRRLRLHAQARLPPDPGHARGDRRGAAHPRCARARRTAARGALRFVDELIARVARAGATGVKLLRADSGVLEQEADRAPGAGRLAVLDRRAPAGLGPGRDRRRSPRRDWQPLDDYPDDGEAQIAETIARRPAPDRPPHPPGRRAGRAVAGLAALRVPHQPHRAARARRGRAPPARRRRARDPRPQRPGARALPLRPLQRQRRLDGDRLRWRTTCCAGPA